MNQKTGLIDREIWVGETKLSILEDGILEIISVGEIDAQKAIEIGEMSIKLMGGTRENEDALTLVDINKAGRLSPEARKIFKSYSKEGKGSTAIFGMHPVARVLAAFFINFVANNRAKFFNTREEALTWLRNKRIVDM